MDLVTTLLVGVILYFLHYLVSKKLKYWESRGFPLLNGSILHFLIAVVVTLFPTKYVDEAIITLYKSTKGKKVYGVNFFFTPKLFLRDPEVINSVLVKDFSHFADRQFMVDEESDPLSGNLFFLNGERWRGLRKKMLPSFTSGKLKLMFPQIADCSDEVMTYIKGKSGPIEVKAMLSCFALNVTGSVAFGMKVDALECLEGKRNQFVELAQKNFKPSTLKMLRNITYVLFRRLANLLGITLFDKDVSEFFVNVIKDTVKYRKDTGTTRNDFLQLMINIKEKDDRNDKQTSEQTDLDDSQHDANDKELLANSETVKDSTYKYKFTEDTLASNSFTFIVGGSETTATILTFALYEISANPHIQKKLQDEIDNVLSDQNFDYSAINSMSYLDCVVNETLRKHPPVISLDRVCIQDCTISGTNYHIKKGEELYVPVVALHHDPDFFPDPETFDPERFLEPNTIKKGTYLPFGAGPRFCIGMRLATMEVKIFLAKTVNQYHLKLKSKLPLTFAKSSQIKTIEGGLWIEFEPRN